MAGFDPKGQGGACAQGNGGDGEESDRGQAQPLRAETAGFWGLYMIECIEVNSETCDQEEATW